MNEVTTLQPPTFSIIVPTVNRPETLIHTLRTILAQDGGDYEVIVSDDQGPPENRAIVDSLGRRDVLRYFRTDRRMGMRGNYEYSVARAAGQYVTILGDDDGLVCNCLALARQVLAQTRPDVLFWFPHVYWWPNALIPAKRGMLYVRAGQPAVKPVLVRQFVDAFFRQQKNLSLFERLPSIYNGFVSRKLLERLYSRTGQYFCDEIPDVYSGIANGIMAESAVMIDRPLTIRGLCGKSYGVAFRNKQSGAHLRDDFKKHMATPMCEPDLVDSSALAVHLASVRMRAMRRFTELSVHEISIPDIIVGILSEINEDADRYDDLVNDAVSLAGKYGLTINGVPPRPQSTPSRRWGLATDQEGNPLLAINTELLPIENIFEVSKLVHAILG